jgi:hypothetical protein
MTNKLVVIIKILKVPKIKKILPFEMKFLVPNYSCLQNPWLGGYCPQIPVLSVVCPQMNLLNPPPKQNSWVCHWMTVTKLWTIQALCDVTLYNLVSSYWHSEELLCWLEGVFDPQDEGTMILWNLSNLCQLIWHIPNNSSQILFQINAAIILCLQN